MLKVIIVPGWVRSFMNNIVKGWLAITLGHTCYAARELTYPERVHEETHMRQWEQFGFLFLFKYIGASISAWRMGHDWYYANVYEVVAYANQYKAFDQQKIARDYGEPT